MKGDWDEFGPGPEFDGDVTLPSLRGWIRPKLGFAVSTARRGLGGPPVVWIDQQQPKDLATFLPEGGILRDGRKYGRLQFDVEELGELIASLQAVECLLRVHQRRSNNEEKKEGAGG
jgi:hypothetical protein